MHMCGLFSPTALPCALCSQVVALYTGLNVIIGCSSTLTVPLLFVLLAGSTRDALVFVWYYLDASWYYSEASCNLLI